MSSISPNKRLIREFFDDFILSKKATRRSNRTIAFYEFTAGSFVESVGDFGPNELGAKDTRLFRSVICERDISDATVHACARGVRAFLRFLKREGYLDTNVDVQMPRLREKPQRARSQYELRALLEWFDLVYVPAIQSIRENGILERFPDRTQADLFIWTWQHQDQLLECYPEIPDSQLEGNTLKSILARLWRNIRGLR